MRKVPLYSSSRLSRAIEQPGASESAHHGEAHESTSARVATQVARASWLRFCERHERLLTVAGSALAALLLIAGYAATRPAPRPIVQQDIDAAVLHTLESKVLPSAASKAYDCWKD